MRKVAAMLTPGDKLTKGPNGPVVILRGPRVSQKWSPGMVHFEVEDTTGRVYVARFPDTERVEIA